MNCVAVVLDEALELTLVWIDIVMVQLFVVQHEQLLMVSLLMKVIGYGLGVTVDIRHSHQNLRLVAS